LKANFGQERPEKPEQKEEKKSDFQGSGSSPGWLKFPHILSKDK